LNEEKYRETRKLLLGYLANIAKGNNISISEISKKTGFTESNIKRLFAGKYNPDLEMFIILVEAIDVQIQITPKQ